MAEYNIKKISNKNLQITNIYLTIVVIVLTFAILILTGLQINYTEKATRADRIQQDLSIQNGVEYCKENPEDINSGLYRESKNKSNLIPCPQVISGDYLKNNNSMNYIILILVAIVGIIIGGYFGARKQGGLIFGQTAKKRENKKKILGFLRDSEKITNNQVEKLLKVSDSTAERYLNELEKEQKIKQIGIVGQGVFYRLIKP